MSASNAAAPRVGIVQSLTDTSGTTVANPSPAPRLLIVDDISDNRMVLSRRFQRRGFEVVEADNGLTAIELIGQTDFDVILLDVMMPGIDGIETLRRIRTEKSSSVLPVIMVTAKAESENSSMRSNWARMTTSPSRSISSWLWRGSTPRSAASRLN